MVQKFRVETMFGSKNLGHNKIWSKKVFVYKRVLGPKKLGQKNLGPKNCLVKIGPVTAEILQIWTNVARTNVAWTNVTETVKNLFKLVTETYL